MGIFGVKVEDGVLELPLRRVRSSSLGMVGPGFGVLGRCWDWMEVFPFDF